MFPCARLYSTPNDAVTVRPERDGRGFLLLSEDLPRLIDRTTVEAGDPHIRQNTGERVGHPG
ncbi:MAG: hypothetical protein ACRD4I_11505, partial [Candidatus Angelobacter sp.]